MPASAKRRKCKPTSAKADARELPCCTTGSQEPGGGRVLERACYTKFLGTNRKTGVDAGSKSLAAMPLYYALRLHYYLKKGKRLQAQTTSRWTAVQPQ